MEHLYAQFEGNFWLDLSKVVAACPGEFAYGKAVQVPAENGVTFSDGTLVKSVLVARDEETRLYIAIVVAGKKTYRAVQVVADRDGSLERLIKGV